MYNRILRDGFGNASCDGSGFVMRREAIEMIGGWPTHSVSDDSLCSEMLLAAGWKLAIVNEKLQTGIQPDTMAGYLKQRMRWVGVGLSSVRSLANACTRSLAMSKWLDCSTSIYQDEILAPD